MTRNGYSYRTVCAQCGETFDAKSRLAKTCSNACRLAMSRSKRKGNGKTWHDVAPRFMEQAQQIYSLSPDAYATLNYLLETYGATVASLAINAAYESSNATLKQMETVK